MNRAAAHSKAVSSTLALRTVRGVWFFTLLVVLFKASNTSNAEVVQGCSTVDARAVSLDDHWVLMREDGKVLTSERYCGGGEYSDGVIGFSSCGTRGYTFLTPEGKTVVKVSATATGGFSEGLAAIQVDGELWGYMNRKGEVVITPRFDEASSFNEGLAAVSLSGQRQYIDKSGKTVLVPHMEGFTILSIGDFKSAAARIMLYDRDTNLKGLIDHLGNWLVEPTPELIGEVNNGLVPFEVADGKIGFMDTTGRIVIGPQFTFLTLLHFQEDLAAVYIGRTPDAKAGFIDKSGQWVIRPQFSEAYHFCGGLAPVKAGDKWGFVNKKGDLVIAPQFETAESFDGGIAEVLQKDKDGKLRRELINRKGTVLFRSSRESVLVGFD